MNVVFFLFVISVFATGNKAAAAQNFTSPFDDALKAYFCGCRRSRESMKEQLDIIGKTLVENDKKCDKLFNNLHSRANVDLFQQKVGLGDHVIHSLAKQYFLNSNDKHIRRMLQNECTREPPYKLLMNLNKLVTEDLFLQYADSKNYRFNEIEAFRLRIIHAANQLGFAHVLCIKVIDDVTVDRDDADVQLVISLVKSIMAVIKKQFETINNTYFPKYIERAVKSEQFQLLTSNTQKENNHVMASHIAHMLGLYYSSVHYASSEKPLLDHNAYGVYVSQKPAIGKFSEKSVLRMSFTSTDDNVIYHVLIYRSMTSTSAHEKEHTEAVSRFNSPELQCGHVRTKHRIKTACVNYDFCGISHYDENLIAVGNLNSEFSTALVCGRTYTIITGLPDGAEVVNASVTSNCEKFDFLRLMERWDNWDDATFDAGGDKEFVPEERPSDAENRKDKLQVNVKLFQQQIGRGVERFKTLKNAYLANKNESALEEMVMVECSTDKPYKRLIDLNVLVTEMVLLKHAELNNYKFNKIEPFRSHIMRAANELGFAHIMCNELNGIENRLDPSTNFVVSLVKNITETVEQQLQIVDQSFFPEYVERAAWAKYKKLDLTGTWKQVNNRIAQGLADMLQRSYVDGFATTVNKVYKYNYAYTVFVSQENIVGNFSNDKVISVDVDEESLDSYFQILIYRSNITSGTYLNEHNEVVSALDTSQCSNSTDLDRITAACSGHEFCGISYVDKNYAVVKTNNFDFSVTTICGRNYTVMTGLPNGAVVDPTFIEPIDSESDFLKFMSDEDDAM